MTILAGDIGGTKTNLGLFEPGEAGRPRVIAETTLRTHDQPDLAGCLKKFIESQGRKTSDISAAAFGIAGPVEDGVCVAEWLPWKRIDERELAKSVGIEHVWLLNDMVAMAHGVTVVPPDQLITIHKGVDKPGHTKVVIAAGTGLGESALISLGDGRYHAVACEGGHTDWAPRTETELGLFRWLAKQIQPVNQETVICGRGLVNVYNYLKSVETNQPQTLAPDGSQAGDIAAAAAESRDPIAVKAMELFLSSYGARAGNLAMQFMASGGVYVTGGIAAKNLEKMQDGTFVKAFLDKGELFGGILNRFPVHIVTEQRAALLGAAHYAMDPS